MAQWNPFDTPCLPSYRLACTLTRWPCNEHGHPHVTTTNLQTYQDEDIVAYYAKRDDLYKPELALLDRLGKRLADMNMLDLGVGGGRTTHHFAARAKNYIGVDYAANMVRACGERFADRPDSVRFLHGDVTELHAVTDGWADLVLFSFNGLDYMDHEKRLTALGQIHRTLTPGGIFCFSSHNLQGIERIFRLRWCFSPGKLFRRIRKFWRLKRINQPLAELNAAAHAMINDGTYHFGLSTYHIRPEEQIKQLQEAGFESAEVSSVAEGRVYNSGELPEVIEAWVYYYCRRTP